MPQQFHIRSIPGTFAFIFILCYSILLNYNSGFAQAAKPAADTTKIVKVIEPISLANIGTETESTLSKIRAIKDNIKPTDTELGIDTLMPKKIAIIEKLKKDLDLEEIKEMNLKQTEGLKNDFSQLRNQLNEWRSTLMKKTEEIKEKKTELADIKTQWDKTLNLERDEKLPQQVKERIQTNLEEVNKLNKDLTNRNNALLTQQDELTGGLIFLDEALNIIAKTELSYRTQIFSINSPRVWQMFSVEKDTITFSQKIGDIVTSHNNNFKNFKENYRENIYFHLLFFIVLLILSLYLKNDIAKWSDEKKDDAIKSSLYVISSPFSASLLVSLLLTGLFYPEAPADVLDYFYALLVIPILTIVPGIISGIDKKYIYFVGGVFVLSQFADYFSDLVVLDRSLLLLLDVVTIVLLITILRSRKGIRKKSPNASWGFVFAIMRLIIMLLAVSVIANSFGNTTLSKIVSQGSLVMIYGGTIIYAGAIILRSLFALLLQQDAISKLNMIKEYPDEVKKQVFRIIRWAAVLYWLYITLSGYLIFDSIYAWFEEMITREWEVGLASFSAGSFLAFFITLWISLTISRFIQFILKDEILTHFEMPRGVPGAISMMVKLILVTLGIVLAFGAAGIEMSQLTIIIGALGVGIGFGLQSIFNNLVSGLILAFERPIQRGDIIQIANLDLMGEVKEIGIRASTIRTFDGAEVIVPNGNLISNEMINWTLSDPRKRQEIIVGVAYGTDINKVLQILNEVVADKENVLKNPKPFIIFLGFGDSSLDFRVLFWTHFDNGLGTKSAVGIAIDEAFKKEGIQIPFPQQDLHLRSISDTVDFQKGNKKAQAKTVRKPGTRKTTATPKKDDTSKNDLPSGGKNQPIQGI